MTKDMFGLPGDLEALANKQLEAESWEFVLYEIFLEPFINNGFTVSYGTGKVEVL
jgi:hypothetical protein